MEFNTRVAGIPCICNVTYFSEFVPGCYSSGPGGCYPDEPLEFEFDILDRNGCPAQWLESKLDDHERERILEEFNSIVDSLKLNEISREMSPF